MYNSLQTKLQRRFQNGFFLINSFTWSRGIDLSSANLENGNGDSALQFRLEAFNVLNSTNFISPASNVATVNATTGVPTFNSSFGTFTGSSSVYPSRQVQMALRLEF